MGAGFNDVIPQIMQLVVLSILGLISLYFRMKFVLTHEPHPNSTDPS
jgi:hypothetical protein